MYKIKKPTNEQLLMLHAGYDNALIEINEMVKSSLTLEDVQAGLIDIENEFISTVKLNNIQKVSNNSIDKYTENLYKLIKKSKIRTYAVHLFAKLIKSTLIAYMATKDYKSAVIEVDKIVDKFLNIKGESK